MAKSILIADDDNDLVELLTLRCKSLRLEVLAAGDAMQALKLAEQIKPDLMILDVDMPSGNGLSACEMMSNHQGLNKIPVIVLTGSSSEGVVKRCHELCAYYVQKAPNVWDRIEPLVREVLQLETSMMQETVQSQVEPSSTCTPAGPSDIMEAVFAVLGVEECELLDTDDQHDEQPTPANGKQPWVLSIEDDDDVALALKLRLQEFGVKVIRASAGTEGYRKAFLNAPRAIILDYELPQGNGDYVLNRLKESPATRDIPVIVLTGRREASIERQMRGLGASEFLTKPIQWGKLRAALGVEMEKVAAMA